MNRYKSIFNEGKKDNLLNNAEEFLNNGNYHSAVRSVALSMGIYSVPHKYDKDISREVHNHMQSDNNINNFAFVSNIQKILQDKKDLIKMKPNEKLYKQDELNTEIEKAIKIKNKEFNKERKGWEAEKLALTTPVVEEEPVIEQEEEPEEKSKEELEGKKVKKQPEKKSNKKKESNMNRYKPLFKENYQGWTNWETWNVNLWILNDEYNYRQMLKLKPFDKRSAEKFVKNIFPDGTPDMDSFKQYLKVDWNEIADSFNEE